MNGIRKPNFITQSYLIKPSRFATNLPAGKKMSTKKIKLKPQIIMSEGHIPFEIQEEIIKRLPVKSLIRFTSVSKTWKSLIHSSKFIADHSLIQPQNLLVSYYDKKSYKEKYVSIVDDETFPQHKSSLPIPLSVSKLERPRSMIGDPCIVSSSHGLICCYGYHNDHHRTINKETVVIWNPSIRRSVNPIVVLYRKGMCLNTFVGFWVCPCTFDPKLVKIMCRFSVWGHIKATIPWQVEVFTLSSRVWRSPLCGTNNLPRTSIIFTDKQVVVDGIMYWLAYDKTAMHDELCNLIIPFDLTSEEFGEVYLPDSLATGNYHALSVSKLNESLVVLKMIYKDHRMRVCDVWMMMKDHVPKSFTKLYTINAPHFPASLSVLGFRKNGEPITKKGGYKLSTEHINDLGIDGAHGTRKHYFCLISQNTLFVVNYDGAATILQGKD